MLPPLGQDVQVEKSVIHVPQGRSARTDKSATQDKVGSLFTYGIGTCHVVSFISKERFSLMHIDTLIPLESMDGELEWVGKDAEVIVLSREGNPVGKVIHLAILSHLAAKGVTHKVIPIDPGRDGVQLFSEPVNTGTVHPHLLIHEIGSIPKNLRRHHQELKFTTAQKIEQLFLIGIKNRPSKKTVVYDGECWQNIPETEFDPHCATKKEQGYLTRLRQVANQPNELLRALVGIVQEVQTSTGAPLSDTPINFAVTLLEHVENYVTGFDYVSLFKRNMLACLEDRMNPMFCRMKKLTLTGDDKKYMKQAVEVLKGPKDPYPEAKRIFEEYEGKKTPVGVGTLQEFTRYQKNYLNGKMYAELEEENLRGRDEAKQEAKAAAAHHQAGEFEKEAEHFEKALRLAQWHYDAGQSALATFYNNYGAALHCMDRIDQANRFLVIAKRLKEKKN